MKHGENAEGKLTPIANVVAYACTMWPLPIQGSGNNIMGVTIWTGIHTSKHHFQYHNWHKETLLHMQKGVSSPNILQLLLNNCLAIYVHIHSAFTIEAMPGNHLHVHWCWNGCKWKVWIVTWWQFLDITSALNTLVMKNECMLRLHFTVKGWTVWDWYVGYSRNVSHDGRQSGMTHVWGMCLE